MRGWADGELDNQRDGVITLGEAQAYTAHKTLQLGLPATPSVFLDKDVQDWKIHMASDLEEGPNNNLMEQLSISIRMRSFTNAADLIRAEATTVWNNVLYDVQKGGSQGEDSLRHFLEEYERASITQEWMVYVPQVAEARRFLRDYDAKGNIVQFDPQACLDTEALEASAMLGELSIEEMACVEAQLRLERIQTKKSKLSTLLINNAFNAEQWNDWENLMRQHLDGIDRSQPDQTFAFAIYLRQKGAEYFEEALGWSEYTQDTRSAWPEGKPYVQKSNKLFQFRAEVAMELWIIAEKRYTDERTAELDQLSREARGLTKDLAREWLDYAQKTDQNTKRAFNMCMSASEDPSYCKE